jgi:hypothetical protein
MSGRIQPSLETYDLTPADNIDDGEILTGPLQKHPVFRSGAENLQHLARDVDRVFIVWAARTRFSAFHGELHPPLILVGKLVEIGLCRKLPLNGHGAPLPTG